MGTLPQKAVPGQIAAIHWKNAWEAIPPETTIFEMGNRQKFIAISKSL